MKALERQCYVSSPLGIRARIGMICRGLRARDPWDSAHSGPEGHGHVRVRHHPWDGLVDGIQTRHRL